MIPDQVLEQLASASFDKHQVIIVTKMLLVTVEATRNQMRAEMRQELAAMRGDYGRLIIEAVEATEKKIFARLDEERTREEEKKRERREAAAARKKEREAAKLAKAAVAGGGTQTGLFDDVSLEMQGLQGGSQEAVDGDNLPRMRAVVDEQPVTGGIAAKIEDNAAYKELMEQWEKEAAKDAPQKPIGSPMAAVKSLGEAMVASFKKQQEEEQARQQGGDVLMIEQSPPDMPVDVGALTQAAE